MTNKTNIKIQKLAKKICDSNSKWTRSELAYELRNDGILTDSEDITRMVWEAYIEFNQDTSILHAFTNNESTRPLVECYQIAAAINNNDRNSALLKTQEEMQEASNTLMKLEKCVSTTLSDADIKQINSIANTITGTAGVQKVKNEAAIMFRKYTDMVNGYESARCNVQEATSAFIELRSDINNIYMQYALALTDIFGDSIKAIQPDLFNFDSIEWLDVQNMLSQIELQYTTVTSRCFNLMGEISESFHKTLDNTITTYRSLNDKQIGLIVAGLNMMGHYLSAQSRTNELKADFVRLKNDMRRDATHIQADMGRLMIIFKKLNDLFIPQANTFYRFSDKVLNEELKKLINVAYSTPKSKEIKEKRDSLIGEMRILERRMNDEMSNITYYKGHIKECEELLKGLETQYSTAISSRPSKPFFLTNLFTLGHATSKYNRNIYEWNLNCGSLVQEYESAVLDLDLDKKDLVSQQNLYNKDYKNYQDIKQKVNALTKQIMEELKNDSEAKVKILKYLQDIVALLRVAKSIMENKLDDKDVKIKEIKEFTNLEIPEDIQNNINIFAKSLQSMSPEVTNYLGEEILNLSIDSLKRKKLSDQNTNQNNQDEKSENQLIADNIPYEQALNLFERWSELQVLKAKETESVSFYKKQLDDLQKEFQQEMKRIDNHSELLKSIISKANTAHSEEELKQGLMALADISEEEWNANDWDKFLSGEKTLII